MFNYKIFKSLAKQAASQSQNNTNSMRHAEVNIKRIRKENLLRQTNPNRKTINKARNFKSPGNNRQIDLKTNFQQNGAYNPLHSADAGSKMLRAWHQRIQGQNAALNWQTNGMLQFQNPCKYFTKKRFQPQQTLKV